MLDYGSLVSANKKSAEAMFRSLPRGLYGVFVLYLLSHDHLAALVSEGIYIHSGRDACGVD